MLWSPKIGYADPPGGETTVAPPTTICDLDTDTHVYTNDVLTWEGNNVWRYGSGTTWDSIGPLWSNNFSAIYGGGYGVFATQKGTGDIYKWSGVSESSSWLGGWHRIGGAAAEFAVTNEGLYGLTPDRSAIYRYNGSGTSWTHVGGAARHIYGGGYGVLSAYPWTGNIYRYQGTPGNWSYLGSAGAEFALSNTGIIKLASDRQSVWKYDGLGGWGQIGGPAEHVYAGSDNVYLATNPTSGNLYMYVPWNGSWQFAGGPTAQVVVTNNGSIFGLTPDKQSIWKYNGYGLPWSKISRNSPIANITSCLTR